MDSLETEYEQRAETAADEYERRHEATRTLRQQLSAARAAGKAARHANRLRAQARKDTDPPMTNQPDEHAWGYALDQRFVLRWLQDHATGYLVDGKTYHPADVTIVLRSPTGAPNPVARQHGEASALASVGRVGRAGPASVASPSRAGLDAGTGEGAAGSGPQTGAERVVAVRTGQRTIPPPATTSGQGGL
jgi:hypothetical protein